MLRPITLWPFPKKAISQAADQVKCFVSVELSMGQMVEDIQLATEVHHLEPIDVNWNRRLDITNLKGDCKAHHSAEESHHKRPGGGSKSTSGQRA